MLHSCATPSLLRIYSGFYIQEQKVNHFNVLCVVYFTEKPIPVICSSWICGSGL